MSEWKRTLPNGKKIRGLIQNNPESEASSNRALLKELFFGFNWLAYHCDAEDDTWLDQIALNSYLNPDEDEEEYEYTQDDINYILLRFYDICDKYRVWVSP